MTPSMASSTPRRVGQSDEWWTPQHIIEAVGPFTLDPCSPGGRLWETADLHYTENQDGLSLPWSGMVWLNPPYSNPGPWLRRMATHNNGVALVFARCETRWWFEYVWPYASSLLFLKGRVSFVDGRTGEPSKPGHNAGGPSVLVSYGDWAKERLVACPLPGVLVSEPFVMTGANNE